MIIGHYKQCSLELIGKDHVQSGLPCQDKTAFAMKDGVRVIALADGAGSKKDSHLGAEITTNTVVKMLANNFDDYFTLLEDEPDRANVLGKEIIKEVYQGLDGLESAIRSSPGFQVVAERITNFNQASEGNNVVILPSYFTSKKQIVDLFIDDVAEKAP